VLSGGCLSDRIFLYLLIEMANLRNLISLMFDLYSLLILLRVLSSWFPGARNPIVDFLKSATDPTLELFKKVVPPIGMIDITPILAIISLDILKAIVISFLR